MAPLNRTTADQARSPLFAGALISLAAAAGTWGLTLAWPNWMALPTSVNPIQLAFQCIAAAALLGPFLAIEAVAHERLITRGVDPLSGYTSIFLETNQLYLRGSVEQWVVFAAGLLGLAATAPASTVRTYLVVATMVWIANRLLFRLGYVFGAAYRGIGLGAHAQSLAILLYVTVAWADNVAGLLGRIAVLGLFLVVEALLVVSARRAARA